MLYYEIEVKKGYLLEYLMDIFYKDKFFKDCTDIELCNFIKNGNGLAFCALLEKYLGLIKGKVKKYSISFSKTEEEDLIQEGVVALLNAARSYNASLGLKFSTYAYVCIERCLINMYKSEKKKTLAENLVCFEGSGFENFFFTDNNPEDFMINKDNFNLRQNQIVNLLSPLEIKVISLYIKDCTYNEISERLSINEKAVDNAIQRIRKKLKNKLNR